MEAMTLTHKIINTIQHHMADVIAIYLFGSAETKYETPDSDVDIAILAPRKISAETRDALIDILISVLHKDKIDLIDLKNAPTVLKFQIIMNGKRIFCSNKYEADSFEMYTFSDYVRLNEARRGILEAIKKRGSIF